MTKKAKFSGVTISLAMASMLIASSTQAATLGQKRCMILDKQLSDVLHQMKPNPARSMTAFGDKARSLCQNGKTSQGLRAYAKALKSLGSQPNLPADRQTNKG